MPNTGPLSQPPDTFTGFEYTTGASVVAGVGGGVAGVEEVAEVVGVPGHGPGVV